jgi:hypothetical protein
MSDRPCWVYVTKHGCIVGCGPTPKAARAEAARKKQLKGGMTVQSTVVRVRTHGRWAFECEKCRRPSR